jgi:UDP-N-acetylglucosamine diphosphorylase/glucosamine-1-phosphate N-acetyltransferase
VNPTQPEGDVLFVAAALGRPGADTLRAISELQAGEAIVAGDRLLAARGDGEPGARLVGALREIAGRGPFPESSSADWPRLLPGMNLSVEDGGEPRVPSTLVDLMAGSGEAAAADFEAVADELPSPDPGAFPAVHLLERSRIRLGADVRLDPGVVLDARDGPILLGPGTRVMANSVLQGPVTTDRDCLFKPVTRAMDGVCLGPVCRVGGEIDATVVLGFTNKQHDGFLGHSYLGCWVNLGAATDTSDLKNDYGFVKITIAGETVDTGSRHVGTLIGDHSKTAIHTRLNTGTVIGVSANVFGTGFPSKEIPSFTWGAGPEMEEYRLEKAIRVASIVTGRRSVRFGSVGERLFGELHRATAGRRAARFGAKSR